MLSVVDRHFFCLPFSLSLFLVFVCFSLSLSLSTVKYGEDVYRLVQAKGPEMRQHHECCKQ